MPELAFSNAAMTALAPLTVASALSTRRVSSVLPLPVLPDELQADRPARATAARTAAHLYVVDFMGATFQR
jgi:hypothetical protein